MARRIRDFILDPAGNPVAGELVKLRLPRTGSSPAGQHMGVVLAVTEADGSFEFNAAESGDFSNDAPHQLELPNGEHLRFYVPEGDGDLTVDELRGLQEPPEDTILDAIEAAVARRIEQHEGSVNPHPQYAKAGIRTWDVRARPTDAAIVADFLDPAENDLSGWSPYRAEAGFSYAVENGGLALTIENLDGWRGICRPVPEGDWTAVINLEPDSPPVYGGFTCIGLQVFESQSPDAQAVGFFAQSYAPRKWAQIRYWGNRMTVLLSDTGIGWFQLADTFDLWFTPTLLGIAGQNLQSFGGAATPPEWNGYARYFRLWPGQHVPRLGRLVTL